MNTAPLNAYIQDQDITIKNGNGKISDFVDFGYKNITSENWNKIDFKKKLKFGLDHFTGARIALFNYSTKKIGGKSFFSNFKFIKE